MTKTQLFRRLAVLAIAGGLVACGMLAGIDDFRIGECKGGKCVRDSAGPEPVPQDDNDATVPVADTGVPCIGRTSPAAIRVGTPPSTFCIDTTEVSNADYNQFLEAKVDISGQPAVCAWNTTYAPVRPPVSLDASAEAQAPKIPDNVPVTEVDWCDAYAYCKWAGKYLCAEVDDAGKRAGPVNEDTLSNFKANQWLLACSAEARLRYPYGGTFDGTRCNVANLGEGGLLPVGSLPGCVGGYEGLHDMVGNAWEWFDGPCSTTDAGKPDAAEGSQSDSCVVKGAAFDNNGVEYDCAYNLFRARRDFHGRNVGFRCCSD